MGAGSCVYLGGVYKDEWFDGSTLKFVDLQQLSEEILPVKCRAGAHRLQECMGPWTEKAPTI